MSGVVESTRARPRGATRAFWVGALLLIVYPAHGQSETGDAEAPPTEPAAGEVQPPRALAAQVVYPEGARGDQQVVLELVVDERGKVVQAEAVRGAPPFSEAAEQAALAWTFAPATRRGQALKAKIRFLVNFVEPTPDPAKAEPEETRSSKPEELAPAPPSVGEVTSPEPIHVTVRAERPDPSQEVTQAEVRQLPGAFGDPFRSVDILPGVVPIVSGLPYFYVRGAPPGNVGYLFDGIPVPTLFHFAAGPGVLHPTFVDGIELYAGAYPARFGRFTGGVVEGGLAPPSYRWRGEASVRLVDSGGMVEAPFDDGRGSIIWNAGANARTPGAAFGFNLGVTADDTGTGSELEGMLANNSVTTPATYCASGAFPGCDDRTWCVPVLE